MRLLLVTIFCLMAVGCNSDLRCRRETALLRAEILDLEDKYYALKSQHSAVINQLDGSTVMGETYYDGGVTYDGQIIYDGEMIEGGTIQYDGQIIDGPITYDTGMPRNAVGGVGNSGATNNINSGNDPQSLPNNGEGPQSQQIELDSVDSVGSEANNDATSIMLNSPTVAGQTNGLPVYGMSYSKKNSPAMVTEVIINSQATRGRDVDGIAGDEGVDILIQPRTADGRVELLAGELSVSLIDPAESASRQRIGLWKFLPEETELFFAEGRTEGRGILLHLPWDQSTPVNERLILHVRFVTPDDRELKTSTQIRITPPDQSYSPDDPLVAGWTQSDSRWLLDAKPEPVETPDWRRRNSTVPTMQASTIRTPTPQSEPARSPFRLQSARPSKTAVEPKASSAEKPAWRPVR